jgi:DNA invertase Pin-like site-specific DNA recombinase
MNDDHHLKVTADHLKRDAYLYIRQSTIRQVIEHTESAKRQYALRQRAVALGWPLERIIVIDDDQGQSGVSAENRKGFQQLVAKVGMGHAGIVLGLEVSRLARNNSDWHRLLEICGLSQTLILDEDGLYDPTQFNDRLLLGLKGTLSEAELHVIKARLQGGIRSKARRGELRTPLPVGFIYDSEGHVVLDPDQQVQQALRTFFQAYHQTSSATATVKHFRKRGLLFPSRPRCGLDKGQLHWGPLVHSQALGILHKPRYAGAFTFGRSRVYKTPDGRVNQKMLPQDQWHTLLPDTHPGYITWEQYQQNQQQLRECAQAHGQDRRKSPPGEGPALLQGLVVCGICGQRMTVRYNARKRSLRPRYVCQRQGIEHAKQICQSVPGMGIDEDVGELLVHMVEPMTLEAAFAVQEELQSRLEEADRLRKQQVERARYEADLARHRYMQVDPRNRLVADSLEADWNDRLRALAETQEQYERQRQEDRVTLDEKSRAQILSLVTDFPRLWRDPKTPDRERKRMVRLMIEDVTLIQAEQITAHVRFKGGAARTLTLSLPLSWGKARKTSPEVLAAIDRLLDEYTEGQIATELNRRGLRTGGGVPFTTLLVGNIRRIYRLKTRYDRLREVGMLTVSEVARKLGVAADTVKIWRRKGLVRAYPYNENQHLYEPIGEDAPVKCQGSELSKRRRFPEVTSTVNDEVQHAT